MDFSAHLIVPVLLLTFCVLVLAVRLLQTEIRLNRLTKQVAWNQEVQLKIEEIQNQTQTKLAQRVDLLREDHSVVFRLLRTHLERHDSSGSMTSFKGERLVMTHVRANISQIAAEVRRAL